MLSVWNQDVQLQQATWLLANGIILESPTYPSMFYNPSEKHLCQFPLVNAEAQSLLCRMPVLSNGTSRFPSLYNIEVWNLTPARSFNLRAFSVSYSRRRKPGVMYALTLDGHLTY